MPLRTRLCGTRVRCNVLLEFKTLEYYVRTIPAFIAFTQSMIVAVWLHSHNQQLWLWVSFFSFFYQGHVGKGSERVWNTGNKLYIARNLSSINSSSKWTFLRNLIFVNLSSMSNSSLKKRVHNQIFLKQW